MRSAESAKAVAELQEQAEEQMMTDPARAVATLATAAKISAKSGGMQAAMLEMSIQSLESVLASYPDPERYLQLGRAQFLVGRFDDARTSLAAAVDKGLTDSRKLVEAHCWAGATAQAPGDSRAASRSIESARAIVDQHAKLVAAQADARRRPRPAQRPTFSGDGLGPIDPYAGGGFAPYSADGTMLGLGRGQQATADAPGAVGGGGSVSAEYYAAMAAYEAEQARYDSEVRLANSRAGRFGAQGIQINPRPVDNRVHIRYLNAKAAYDAAQGRR